MDDQRRNTTGEVHFIPITMEGVESPGDDLVNLGTPLQESTNSGTDPGNPSVSPSSDKTLTDKEEAANASLVNKRSSVTPTRFPHKLKTITWHNKKVPVVTQNENGPCPLISIVNVLLLRCKIVLPVATQTISADQLIEYIAESILDNIPEDLSEARMLNYEQNMHDAIAVLPRLMTGLDVNIKFTGVQDFEYTPECIIFDLLNIPLYHGWLVDPQDSEAVAAIGGLGYNQLVDKIIINKSSEKVEDITEALIAEQFLERTASQMTYHGLCELNSSMKENELGVLFRNNHFSTIIKKGHELFQLVTDQGFLHESSVVWETANNIDGAGDFVDSLFKTAPPKSSSSFGTTLAEVSQEQQIDQDAQLARRLQDSENEQAKTTTPIAVAAPEKPTEPPEPEAATTTLPTPRPQTPPDRKKSCVLQ